MAGFSLDKSGGGGPRPTQFAGLEALIREEKAAARGLADVARAARDAAAAAAQMAAAAASVRPAEPRAAAAEPSRAAAPAAQASADVAGTAASFRAALAPLEGFAARMEASFNRVGGTIVTLARRIDGSIKFSALEAGLTKVQEKLRSGVSKGLNDSAAAAGRFHAALQGVAPAADRTIGVLRGFLKVREWLHNLGDVAGKDLGRVANIDYGRSLPGLAGVRSGIAGVGAVAGRAQASVFALGASIAVAFGAVGVTYTFVNFLKTAVKGASDLNETVTATREVFHGSTAVVTAQADEMAKAFGLSRRAQLDVASGFGAIAQGAKYSESESADFANTFTKLAADFSSFKNLPFEDAAEKLRSALSGEIEPLRRYGVVIDEASVHMEAMRLGLSRTGKDLDQHTKMVARASLIQRGLAAASGDLERTADGPANQYRKLTGTVENLAASVGEALMPAASAGLNALNALATAAAAAFESIKPAVHAVAAVALPTLGGVIAAVADKVGEYWAAVKLAASAGAMFATAVLAVARSYAVLVDLASGTNFAAQIDGMIGKLDELRASLEASARGQGRLGDGIRGFFGGGAGAIGDLAGMGAEVYNVGKAFNSLGDSVSATAGKVRDLETNLQAQIEAFGKSSNEADIYKLKVAGASDADLAMARSLDRKLRELKAGAEVEKEFREAAREAIEKSRTPEEKYSGRIAELRALYEQGRIDVETFNRNSEAGFQEFQSSSARQYAGVAESGSKEAYSAILGFEARGREEPIKLVAKNGEKQLTELQKLPPLLSKVVTLLDVKATPVYQF